MELTSLSFSSFKGFDKTQVLSLADLNLIYGSNSAGKSSIFQALLLLKQSAQRAYGAEEGVLEFRGSSADLGGFRTFVHRHDTRRSFTIEMGLRLDAGDRRFRFDNAEMLGPELKVSLTFGLVADNDAEPRVLAVTLEGAGRIRFAYDPDFGALRLADAASSAAIVDMFAAALPNRSARIRETVQMDESDRRWLREWTRKQGCELEGWIPVWSPIGRGKVGRPYGEV